MRGLRALIAAAVLALALPGLAPAQMAPSAEPLPLDGTLSADGTRLELNWPPMRAGQVQVLRRELGQSGAASWQDIPLRELTGFRLVDDALRPGIAYEYQVRLIPPEALRPGRRPAKLPQVGYWAAGREIPAEADSGTALMVVDETLAGALAAPLARFAEDLTGAGWQVQRLDAPRSADDDPAENLRRAAGLRSRLAEAWRQAPDRPHAVILLGHLPVVRTGLSVPDGHRPHAVPSDLYYGDPTGLWPETRSPEGVPQLLPSVLPGPVAMQVGRVDFAHMGAEFGTETGLLTAWLDRNHRWRQGQAGDPRTGYAATDHLAVETAALRNILGPQAVREAGHADPGGTGLDLFGIDFGPARGARYAALPPVPAVFALNFGSGKHRFDDRDNAMTALLAQPGATLTVGWGGRPAWVLHGMALGESIGTAHLRTVNNGASGPRDYLAQGHYDWRPVPWVNLLGDPTLRPFPLPPVTAARAEATAQGVRLSWVLPEGAESARLFRAPAREGPYAPFEGAGMTAAGALDTSPLPGCWYMIRAEGLAQVHAGSFRRLAQGVFVAAP